MDRLGASVSLKVSVLEAALVVFCVLVFCVVLPVDWALVEPVAVERFGTLLSWARAASGTKTSRSVRACMRLDVRAIMSKPDTVASDADSWGGVTRPAGRTATASPPL